MKKWIFFLCCTCVMYSLSAQTYTPAAGNLKARSEFQDAKFGLFIHWGLYSIIGRGEWVLNNDKIKMKNYEKLAGFFNPVEFDPAAWVRMAKDAGMRYITFVTRHHDGFSMWDTKYSDFNVENSLYHKDVLKMLADECHKQNMKLFLYYSLLDWGRDDYPYETGRTGKFTGRTGKSDYAHYLQFMKNQITELLTNYGRISGIWFDGHWDQTNQEGSEDRSSRIDWKYDEIYGLIHKLQPWCLIGNNHHLTPFSGEDFQMFERDLPGENKSGLSFQQASKNLPVEVCETMNNSWGFNLNDDNYKSFKNIIHYLVNAAGRNSNLLLNVGPMPNGKIQTEFVDTLKKVGRWMKQYGESIYGTRGRVMKPQDWGVVTAKDGKAFVHILQGPDANELQITGLSGKVKSCMVFGTNTKIKYRQKDGVVTLQTGELTPNDIDTILLLTLK